MDTISPPMLALVVEDLPPVADWLCRLLHNRFAGIDVRHADCVKDACDVVAQGLQPDLALVDLGLPDGNGTRVIECIKRHHPACMVVVTTLFADDEHLFPALRAGAQGYLLKDQPEDKLSRALEGILRGEPPLSPAIAQRLLRAFQPTMPESGGQGEALTPREREVLVLVSKGCRLPELAERLQISRHTVSDHLKNIYRKLNVNSRAEATLEAARLGLIAPFG